MLSRSGRASPSRTSRLVVFGALSVSAPALEARRISRFDLRRIGLDLSLTNQSRPESFAELPTEAAFVRLLALARRIRASVRHSHSVSNPVPYRSKANFTESCWYCSGDPQTEIWGEFT